MLPTPASAADDADTRALLELETPQGRRFTLTRAFESALLVGFAATPLVAVAYLLCLQDPSLRFTHHGFHELAIGIASLISGFVTYVTWRCYRSSGEAFLRWLTLAFLGFTLIYAPHGVFTRMAEHNMWLFLFYGPVSRFVMTACLFAGLLRYGTAQHAPELRTSRRFWTGWIAIFIGIDLLIAALTHLAPQAMPILRLLFEYGALALALLGIAIMFISRPRSPLMLFYALSLAFSAQASFAFVLARPWDHLWWLAHAISAGGFLLLSYGVLHAFHTTRSFSFVFGHDELIAYLRTAKARADNDARKLQHANTELARLAATDSLTGVANRRHFMERAEAEIARAARNGMPLALLALDIDHFKNINDSFGHATGDRVLQHFCATVEAVLRPSDVLGRLGGEEFMVLLPEAGRAEGALIAERIRASVAGLSTVGGLPPLTTSVGIAVYPADGNTLEALLRAADTRLYQAKHDGRNTVVGGDDRTPATH